MGLYKRKGSRFYWMTFRVNSRKVYESTKTTNKKLAERIYAKRLTEITEGKYFETAKIKSIKFEDMVTKYISEHSHSRDSRTAKILLRFFAGFTISQITTKVVSEYRSMRLKEVKPATVYQELALLRRMFNVAIREWEWLRDNPVSRLSFSVGNKNARDRWLTPEEEERLIENATNPYWLRALLLMALHTGMRRGEILNLRWSNINFLKRTIIVVKSKNDEKRTIPMSNTLYNLLNSIDVRDISGRVFPISGSSLRQAFDKLVFKTSLEDFRFHDLRHTFATRLIQAGINIYVIKELLGHKTITMTMRYAHHYPESLRHGVEVMDKNSYNLVTLGVKKVDHPSKNLIKSSMPEWRNW